MAPTILYRSEFSAPAKIAFRFGARPSYGDIVAVREPPMLRIGAIICASTRSLQRLRESEKCMQDYPTTPSPQPSQPGQQDAPPPQPAPSQPPYAAPPPPQYTAPTPMPDTPPPYTPAPASAPAYNPTYAPPYAAPGAANPQNPPRSNRTKWLIGGGIGCGVLLVMCMCVGLLTAILAQGGSSTASGDPTATTQQGQAQSFAPTPTATTPPKPTATTNPNAGAGAYATLVQQDSTTLGNDLSSVSDACGSTQDLDTCRAAWVTIRDDSASFLDDLDAHPTPPCMKTADTSLRAGLNDVHAASLEVIDGIDQYDPDKIKNGATILTKANGEVNDATSALKNASCS